MLATLILAMAALSACAAVPPQGGDVGPVKVAAGGKSYVGVLRQTSGGPALTMTRDGAGFGYDEGLEAKRAAEAFCGGRLNPQALGRFVAGTWVFDGGCA